MLHSMYVSNMDHHSDGNMDHKKQAKITFNFSSRRVPYIQDDEKQLELNYQRKMGSRVG